MKRIRNLVILMVISLSVVLPARAQQSDTPWTPFENLSSSVLQDSEPKIASDIAGNVHVVWSERMSEVTLQQAIYYVCWKDGVWSEPVDVLLSPGGELALVMAIALDNQGFVHVVWVDRLGQLYYSMSLASEASDVRSWRDPLLLVRGVSVTSWAADLLADESGRLHLVYGSARSADLYYIWTEGERDNWSDPVPLVVGGSNVRETVSSVMLAHDAANRLHVVWTSREAPRGWPGIRSFYAQSIDGGSTWSAARLVDTIDNPLYEEDRGPFFLSVDTRGRDEIHLAWAGAPKGERWHQWSSNGGETWSDTTPLPGGDLFGTTGFLDMVEDSSGTLHLFTTFGAGRFPGVPLESNWRGEEWSNLEPLPSKNILNCEDPRVAIALGYQLHIVCVEQSGVVPANVFHSTRALNIPQRAPQPLPPPVEEVMPTTTAEVSSSDTSHSDEPDESTPAFELSRDAMRDRVSPETGLIWVTVPVVFILAVVMLVKLGRG